MAVETLDEFARLVRERVIRESIYTALPARVVAVEFDAARGLVADIQVGVTIPFAPNTDLDDFDDEPSDDVPLPVIFGAPVVFAGAGTYTHTVPVAAGTTGIALVLQTSADEWLAGNGGVRVPRDPRRFSPSDAVFLPGLRPHASAAGVSFDPDAAVMGGALHKFGSSAASATLAKASPTASELAALYTRMEAAYTALNTTLAPIVAAWIATQGAGGGPLVVPPAPPLVPITPWALLAPPGLDAATTADVQTSRITVDD